MMNTQRHRWGIVLLVWVFGTAIAQGDDHFPRAPGNAPAKRVARERYRFLKRLEPKFGFFPLWQTLETRCTALFPLGSAERVYLLLESAEPPGKIGHMILCYQRKKGQDKRVYRIDLEMKDRLENGRPAKTTLPFTNLLDYVTGETSALRNGVKHDEHSALKGRVSRFAQNDLAMKRDYAQYTYIPYIDQLRVWRLSALKNHRLPDVKIVGPETGFYSLDEDPFTKAKLKPGEFYKKYGLPTAPGER